MKSGFFPAAILIFLLMRLLPVPESAHAETISFPLQLDYPFLRTLLIHSAFTDPNQTMRIQDSADPCRQITLSNPSLASANTLLRIEVAVRLKNGIRTGQNCLLPTVWEGYLVAHVQPRMHPGDWTMSFDPVDSVLLDRDHRPNSIMGQMWQLFKTPVMARIANIRMAVNDPFDQLKPFLLAAVPETDHPRVNAMLASLTPGTIAVEPNVMRVEIRADIETVPAAVKPPAPPVLTSQEMDAFIKTWETWDSFLVQTFRALLPMPLTPEERETLLTVLLDTRYRFIMELAADTPSSSSTDFVREQFVDAWEKLSPIFKDHLARQPSTNSWGILAFFTASDALTALDKLGPLFNIEISRNGFVRLARMLSENKDLTLQYSPQVDPDLRSLLGMEPSLDITGPTDNEYNWEPEGLEMEPGTDIPPSSMNARQVFWSKLGRAMSPGVCWAGKSKPSPNLQEIKKWLVTRDNVDAHLQKAKTIMAQTIQEKLKKSSLPNSYHPMFQHAVYATAWQESCFRQFIIVNKKLVYIRSYNNTSVGMMQINERVWRGIYNMERVRWDVPYNIAAGIDIMNIYITKYAIPKLKSFKGKHAFDNDGVASALYAMYNAGPGEFSRYAKRRSAGKFTKIDKHFKEKYTWVKSGKWEKLRDCL